MIDADSSSVTLTWQFVITAVFLIAVFFIGKLKGWFLSRTHKVSSLAAASPDHSPDTSSTPRQQDLANKDELNSPQHVNRSRSSK